MCPRFDSGPSHHFCNSLVSPIVAIEQLQQAQANSAAKTDQELTQRLESVAENQQQVKIGVYVGGYQRQESMGRTGTRNGWEGP